MNKKLFLLAILPVMLVGCSSDGEEKEILPVEAQDIKMSSDFIQVEERQRGVISATVMPENAICKDVIWTSSDYTIADFIDGVVVGLSKGKCSIFASTKDGKIKKECKVEVTPVKISSIHLEYKEVEKCEGQSFKIDYEIYPGDAENKNVIMSSSDPNIVTVDPDGITLHAKIVGKAIITLKAEEGGCVAYCNVEVRDITSRMDCSLYNYDGCATDINGYIIGTVDCVFHNHSFENNIELTRFEVTDSKTQIVAFSTEDISKLGTISPYTSLTLTIKLAKIYKPILTWYFKSTNKNYKISKQCKLQQYAIIE